MNVSLKVFLKKIILIILAIIGYVVFVPRWLGRRKETIVILRYHSVSDHRRHEVNVKVEAFRRQMEFLARHYKILPLNKTIEILKGNEILPKNAVSITFDDGYKDNYTNAYSILRQFHIPATIFLIASYVGTSKILPHDIEDEPSYNYLLSWDEVRKMSDDGIQFGSHTLNHVNLGKRDFDVEEEISESKRIIEEKLGKNIYAISYPFGLLGDFNAEIKEIVRQSGYTCGCSAMNGVNDSSTDIFELRRIGIEASDNMFTFRAKLDGALDLLLIKDTPFFNRILKIFNRLIGV